MMPPNGSDTDDRVAVLRGASASTVRAAIRSRAPFPGTRGFAGEVSVPRAAFSGMDGSRIDAAVGDDPVDRHRTLHGSEPIDVLVRDVLGREPLFVERNDTGSKSTDGWSFDPTTLRDPYPFPPGGVRFPTGVEEWWSLPEPNPTDPTTGQAAVDDAVDAVFADLAEEPTDDVAVAFSGGIDSALVAAGLPDAVCYVAGFTGGHDIAAAREAAAVMDRDLRVVEITHRDLQAAIPEIVAATGRRNAMDVAIALPLYLTAGAAARDGYERLAVGQGADELFGGYSKVVDPAADHRVDSDTVRGARMETVRTLPRQLDRDVLTLRAAGVDPLAPLLDDRIVAAALRLPSELLATQEERKIAVRRSAVGRVPRSVYTADKKAVQYGTYVSREIDRLARQRGFKRRMDDHVGQYIDSLVLKSSDRRG